MNTFEMDEKERISFKKEVIAKLAFIRYMSKADKDPIESALDFLDRVCTPIDRTLDNISDVRDRISAKYRYSVENITPTIYYGELMWAYMYLIAFYKKSTEPLWTDYILPSMMELVTKTCIRDNIQKGRDLIAEYVKKRKRFNTALQQINNQKNSKQTIFDSGISPFHIAEGSKTDVMKVLFYLYDQNVFSDEKGLPLKRKKSQFMKAIGTFFNSDFDNYSQRINAAAAEPNFPDILERMLKDAQQKYADEFK